MIALNHDFVAQEVAHSPVIFQRGRRLYEHGNYMCRSADQEGGSFLYDVDGNYGDYQTEITLHADSVETFCDCMFPEQGCKHTVAVLLDVQDKLAGWRQAAAPSEPVPAAQREAFLDAGEIQKQALADRQKRAAHEEFKVIPGETYKGEHLLETTRGRQYEVVLHNPQSGTGRCSCPDFNTNRLNTCKHLIFLSGYFQRKKDFKKRMANERFPFVDIYWDANAGRPRYFCELETAEIQNVAPLLKTYFDADGIHCKEDLTAIVPLLNQISANKRVRVQETVLERIQRAAIHSELASLQVRTKAEINILKTDLYPYQQEGVRFGLFRPATLIGDEMGLGKTLQAIALAVLKKRLLGFDKVLVVTLASLKEQWKREIERFSDEQATVVAGSAKKRDHTYRTDGSLFKITNYEAVLRDVTILSRYKPDLVILDEAQRIKNFNTKTADAVKRIPRTHALVLTGTPLENKLEDVYSIVQFLDPLLLSPLWQFAADHFMLSSDKKGKILGYRNLDQLHEKLKSIVIRRRKEEVLSDLPEQVENNYYIDLTNEQAEIHAGYASLLAPYLSKKFLTPIDLQRMMMLMLKMRQVCDSTYLIDRETNISPKLKELEGLLDELVLQNNRKVVIFSEWISMTYLIAKHMSRVGIDFVELSGRVPVKKRQNLIDEFSCNPQCKVFLSTDAGSTGLNLQAADCVINFELPWNPAKKNQRIGRVNRIGQKSGCVNVVNLIAKNSIEEKIMAGLKLKTDLFEGVFDGGTDMVEFSQARRTELLNQLREMMGEDLLAERPEERNPDEIPEDTPHFLNPQALVDEDEPLAYDAEEFSGEDSQAPATETGDPSPVTAAAEVPDSGGEPVATEAASAVERHSPGERTQPAQSPEKMEEVLNSGMQFLGGLLEMATGQKIEAAGGEEKMIALDKETGEVTLKFKLPGF